MKRTRVVFSIGALHGGGSERQIVSILKQIDRARFEPILYLVYRQGPLLDELPDDVPIHSFEERFGLPRGPGILMHGKRVADMSSFLREVEADVCYDRTFLMTLIAADAAQRVGVPNLSTIVTEVPEGFEAIAGRFQWAKRRILRRLYSRSAFALANAEGSARSAEAFYGLQPDSVRVLPNGLHLPSIRARSEEQVLDHWWSADQGGTRIVTAGRLDTNKGFHLLIDALAAVHSERPELDFRAAILGDGPQKSRLEQQIEGRGLQDWIHLTGFQDNAPSWFRSADLFVFPSLLEGMPNVIMEAMACQVPVLAADCDSGPREILQHGQFGTLCDVNSVESLKEHLTRFLTQSESSSDDAAARTAAAARHVEENYSIAASVSKLEELFDETVISSSR